MREMDLYQRILPIDEFLALILDVSSNSNQHEIDIILRDNVLGEELDAYARPTNMGQKRYQHFICILNEIISLASQFHHCNDLGIKFIRSSLTFILGTAIGRNLGTAGGELIIDGQSHQVEAIAEKGPTTNALHLADISTFVWFQPRHPPSNPVLDSYVAPSEPVSQSQLSSRARAAPGSRKNEHSQTAYDHGSAPATSGPSSGTRHSNSNLMSGVLETRCVPDCASSNGSGVDMLEGFEAQVIGNAIGETPETQCASGILELLSHGGLRTHGITTLVTSDSLELLYYDRSIIIKSLPSDFVGDQARLVVWVIGMIRLDARGLGFDPIVPRVRHYMDTKITGVISKSLYRDFMVELGPGWELRVKGAIFNAHCIIGRGIAVFLAEVEAIPRAGSREWLEKTVIAKLSNPLESRPPEIEIIMNAFKHAASDNDTKKFMKNLPLIIDHEDRAAGGVQMALFGHFKGLYELRVPRAIIMEQLFPITELTDAVSAAPVYRDIVDCYRWLFDVCEIRHSDISINNLMYRRENGRTHGVLNDFDLASCGEFTGPQSRQRTGTKQFMAYDLLDPHKSHSHFYRHDLESIFYVMVFHFCGHHQGEEIPFSLRDWSEISGGMLWKSKIAFLNEIPPSTTDHYVPLWNWIIKLSLIFRRGYSARVDFATSALLNDSNADGGLKPFNEETLGGHVTFDVFLGIITLP